MNHAGKKISDKYFNVKLPIHLEYSYSLSKGSQLYCKKGKSLLEF